MRKSSYSPGGRANFGDETVVGYRTPRWAFSEFMGFPPVVSEAYKPESEFIHETTAPAVRCSGAYTPLLRIP